MIRHVHAIVIAAVLVWLPVAAQGVLPKSTGRVTDLANVIDAATEADLDRRLDQLEQKTTAEIAVVTVTSLGGTTVEDYASRLFKEWGIGQAKQDNGVLVLVAPNEREMRIEVGYGLEGVMPDGLAGQIIREQFIPRFRDNDYNAGIRDGVARVIDVVERQQVLTPDEIAKLNEAPLSPQPWWIIVAFMSVFVTIGGIMFGAGLRTKTFFGLIFGGFFGGLPLLMAILVTGMIAIYTLVPWGIAMVIAGYRLGARKSWQDSFRQGSKGGRGGGWVMGGSSSGSSGSRSGGSSSSFGGGSSGGGGASGRW